MSTMNEPPTALIADDEPLLRDELELMLAQVWPRLVVTARARNGREAVELYERHSPDICFLDVQMPGLDGLEAAKRIGGRAHLVFVTAFDQYAVDAFGHGAIDYLIKPVEPVRLERTVERLRERLIRHTPPLAVDALAALIERLQQREDRPSLRWIKASVGPVLRMIAVDDVAYFQSNERCTVVAFKDETQAAREAVIRTPLKDLSPQLPPSLFAQVHRSIVVNLKFVSHVYRSETDALRLHLKGRSETLPVSKPYSHLFRQM